MASRRSRSNGNPLIRLHPLAADSALAVRQDNFDVTLIQLAETEVSDRFLAGAVSVADADLAQAQQAGGLAQLAGLINADLRADAHAIDGLASCHGDLQPVSGWCFVAQQRRTRLDPPSSEEDVEPAVTVEVRRRTVGH